MKKSFKRKITNGKGSGYINIPKKIMDMMGWKIGDEVILFPNSTGVFVSVPKVYTLGYEGLPFEEFIRILKEYSIQQVIDVRNTPWSANPRFRLGYLSKILDEQGIFYINLNKLGAPKTIRNIIHSEGYDHFFEEYKKHLYRNKVTFELLIKIINNGRSLLLCYEKDWHICHRRIIAEELQKRNYEVVHIE